MNAKIISLDTKRERKPKLPIVCHEAILIRAQPGPGYDDAMTLVRDGGEFEILPYGYDERVTYRLLPFLHGPASHTGRFAVNASETWEGIVLALEEPVSVCDDETNRIAYLFRAGFPRPDRWMVLPPSFA